MPTLESNFVLNTPARRILALLRHAPMTVEDLAKTARITPNAVRNQLAKLLEASFIVRSGSRPGTSKPSAVFSITVEGQTQFSTIYVPVLTAFMRVAQEQCSGVQLSDLMKETGKSLAERYRRPTGNVKTRANAGARLLKTMGAIPKMRTRNGTIVIQSAGCPLAALTAENTAACGVLEGLLTEHIGSHAAICCTYNPEPRCCFEISK